MDHSRIAQITKLLNPVVLIEITVQVPTKFQTKKLDAKKKNPETGRRRGKVKELRDVWNAITSQYWSKRTVGSI